MKSTLYQIIDGVLFRKNYDGVFLRCLEHEDANKVVVELHDGPARGHFFYVIVTLKCIHLGILCLVPRCLFQDVSVM